MFLFILVMTVKETNEKQFLWLVQSIFETEARVAQKESSERLASIMQVIFVVKVDWGRNHLHMLRSQLHSIADKFDFAPEIL